MQVSYTLDNTDILIASMHHKDRAIMPVMDSAYKNIHWHIAHHLDTDQFGTFSGEKKRPTDMIGTLSMKISAACSLYPEKEIAIGTEGSFVSVFPGMVRSTEYIMLVDKRFGYTFSTCFISIFSGLQSFSSNNWDEVKEYISSSFEFPEEGCIIYPELMGPKFFHRGKKNKNTGITKGITDFKTAKDAFVQASKINGNKQVIVEPDFRAMFHPKRMDAISAGVSQLIEQIKTFCPYCSTPGWSKKSYEGSAFCHSCGSPTNYPTHEIRGCNNCSFIEKRIISPVKFPLDSCSICNP